MSGLSLFYLIKCLILQRIYSLCNFCDQKTSNSLLSSERLLFQNGYRYSLELVTLI